MRSQDLIQPVFPFLIFAFVMASQFHVLQPACHIVSPCQWGHLASCRSQGDNGKEGHLLKAFERSPSTSFSKLLVHEPNHPCSCTHTGHTVKTFSCLIRISYMHFFFTFFCCYFLKGVCCHFCTTQPCWLSCMFAWARECTFPAQIPEIG